MTSVRLTRSEAGWFQQYQLEIPIGGTPVFHLKTWSGGGSYQLTHQRQIMETRKQAVLVELKEANEELRLARLAFADAKRRLTDAESGIINAKLKVERLVEEIRVIDVQQVIPGQHYALFDDDER